MLARFAASIGNAVARFTVREPGRGTILLYHRVAQPARDPQLLAVNPDRFASHLEVLTRCARPMALREMTERLAAGKSLPQRAVALTFDDGYTDNARIAEPLLAKANIPATLFVATGYMKSGEPYWWDAIETALLSAPLPERLELPFPDGPRVWDVTGAPHGSDGWSVLDSAEPASRRAAYAGITAAVKPLDIPARNRVLDALREASNSDLAAEGDARPMTTEAVAQMSRRGVIEIGAHTVHHPQLSVLDADAQEAEIAGSIRAVQSIVGSTPAAFAYPYGSSIDYDMVSLGCVQRAGVRAACSNFPGTVNAKTPPFELPRVLVRNLTVEEFERALDGAFAAERLAS